MDTNFRVELDRDYNTGKIKTTRDGDLRFTVILFAVADGTVLWKIEGFRLIGGRLVSPSSRLKNSFITVVKLHSSVQRAIIQEVRKQTNQPDSC